MKISGLNSGLNFDLSLILNRYVYLRANQGVPCILPKVSWDMLQHPPHNPQQDKVEEMDGRISAN